MYVNKWHMPELNNTKKILWMETEKAYKRRDKGANEAIDIKIK